MTEKYWSMFMMNSECNTETTTVLVENTIEILYIANVSCQRGTSRETAELLYTADTCQNGIVVENTIE